jgi:hypothetical protein
MARSRHAGRVESRAGCGWHGKPHKEQDMTITTTTLFRVAGVAAVLAGVQINHPHLDATSITTADVMATAYVNDVIAAATNRPATGDIGLMHPAILFTGITSLAGSSSPLHCSAPTSSRPQKPRQPAVAGGLRTATGSPPS